MARRNCERCDMPQNFADSSRRFCMSCQQLRFKDNGGHAAYRAVAAAVKRGELAPVRTLACADCGDQASHYDHRDYSKPLLVEPVCRSCNRKRGPAIFFFASEALKARYFRSSAKA